VIEQRGATRDWHAARRLGVFGRVRSVCSAVAVVLTVAACSTGGATTTPEGYRVISRVVSLEDPSRVTDPTPGEGGTDATDGRDLPTTLWYPATGDGPFPLIVFSHGLNALPTSYEDLLERWASAGFVVAAPQFPLTSLGSPGVVEDVLNQPADVSFVLTQVLELGAAANSDLAGRIDTDRIAAAGHSAGAVTTIGLLSTCCHEDRVRAAVVLAGSTAGFTPDFAGPGVPTLWLHGAEDETIPIDDGEAAYAAAPSPKAFVRLTEGGHSAPYDQASDPHRDAVHSVTVDFLHWALEDDATALEALRTDADRSDLAELTEDALPD
jgi:predicted dienelactone hydrolase